MNRKSLLRAASVGLCLTLTVGAAATLLTGCKTVLDNEKTPFVISTDLPDGVFNPFFYTAGADGDIVSQTQIGMLSSNENGLLVAGEDEPCVSQAFGFEVTGDSTKSNVDLKTGIDSGYFTDYYFAIKKGIKFSDGVELTIDDVLFNIYMYLDPAYTGSSTMYSVDIQGLAAYRTQSEDVSNQNASNSYFNSEAEARLNKIKEWTEDKETVWSDLDDWNKVEEYKHVQADILKAEEYFLQELNDDWNSFQDDSILDDYKKYGFKNSWEIFLYEEGIITVTAERDPATKKITGYKKDYNGTENLLKGVKKEQYQEILVNYVYNRMLDVDKDSKKADDFKTYKENLDLIITYYQTASKLREYLVGQAISQYFKDKGGLSITTVSGINVEKRTTMPVTTYYIEKDSNGQETTKSTTEEKFIDEAHNEYDVLTIRINKVDPKAIQNFGFTVAPGHYYSKYVAEGESKTTWERRNYTEGQEFFGVQFADTDFMQSISTNHVPLGAGPYRVTKSTGSEATDKIEKTEFFANGTLVYLQRNDNFMLGAPKIKFLRYQYITTTQLYEATKNQIHFSMPTANADLVNKLNNDKKKLSYTLTDNLGYGYIGINASFINDLRIRQAIMYAMDTSLCSDYYGSDRYCTLIYRAMSTTLKDYYPQGVEAAYKFDGTGQKSLDLANDAGYTLKGNYLENSKGQKLKFTFTIAGESTDHPAYATMNKAADILNKIGFDITVQTSSSALSKLASGQLAVWAAAWSSSTDPDMYQVYHKDSSATSIKAWGYPYLTSRDSTPQERQIIEDLAELIERGRESLDVEVRQPIYAEALNKVMELAVELPTYQRKNIYVYRTNFFDDETLALFKESTAYQSPISKIWLVGYKTADADKKAA